MYETREESQEAKDYSKRVANTIVSQMKQMDMNLMMCMGYRKPLIIPNGVAFTVSGLSFKGQVEITLNSMDTYDLKFIKRSKKINKEMTEILGKRFYDSLFKTVKELKGIYVDELMGSLERVVENRQERVV